MCGRFNRHHKAEDIGERFGVEPLPESGVNEYNISPTQPVPVVIEQNCRKMIICRWGLVPSWSKDSSIGSKLINARAETLTEKPSFRDALERRRCLIPADGFYEWPKKGPLAGKIVEVRRVDGEMFAFAGLWEEWRSPEGLVLRTFTIITVEPNELMERYHHRMPAILRREDEAAWIDRSTRSQEAKVLLRSFPSDELEALPVSRERLFGREP